MYVGLSKSNTSFIQNSPLPGVPFGLGPTLNWIGIAVDAGTGWLSARAEAGTGAGAGAGTGARAGARAWGRVEREVVLNMILLGTAREGGGDELRERKEGLMRPTAESTVTKRNGTNIVDCGEINKELTRLTLFGSCQASNALKKNNRPQVENLLKYESHFSRLGLAWSVSGRR
jgi:hypothetical protein